MGTVIGKIMYAITTKAQIKNAIENKGVSVTSEVFRQYPDRIAEIATGGLDGVMVCECITPPPSNVYGTEVVEVLGYTEYLDPQIAEALDILSSLTYSNAYSYYAYYKQNGHATLLLSNQRMYLKRNILAGYNEFTLPSTGVPIATPTPAYRVYAYNGSVWDAGADVTSKNVIASGNMTTRAVVESLDWLFCNYEIEYWTEDSALPEPDGDSYGVYDIGVLEV